MTWPRMSEVSLRILLVACIGFAGVFSAAAQDKAPPATACRVEPVDYRGWSAHQLSNQWVRLTVVPQNGGRLMQVTFAGHDYLFVNPELSGKYFPPTGAKWFNYGGDKLWLLPEGTEAEQQWVGNSDILDDGPYTFRKISEGQRCEIELVSPADPHTGIQFTRTIRLDSDSSQIRFRASMKNISGHSLEWSMQSVSQYSTSIPGDTSKMNAQVWGFTPVNPNSGYLNKYHVRTGPAENPAASVRNDGLFSIHYVHMAAELWIDSVAGWLAVVDGSSKFAMVEKFQYEEKKTYPGRASVIFWTNGPGFRLNSNGEPAVGSSKDSPYYMEAELNSPMCRLNPGEECHLDTDWFPTRADREIRGVTDGGVLLHSLRGIRTAAGKVRLTGTFGVFYEGRLVARFYDKEGSGLGEIKVAEVTPGELVELATEVAPAGEAARFSLHLMDRNGLDHGALQEVAIENRDDH